MVDIGKLQGMSEVAIMDIDRSLLVDINELQVDSGVSTSERTAKYISQIKNPYCFMSDDTPVRVRFTNRDTTLAEALGNHFMGLKQA